MAGPSITSGGVRAFLAVSLSKDYSRDISRYLKKMPASCGGVKWVDSSHLHLTLHFFGSIPRERIREITTALEPVIASHRSFKIRLAGHGFFPNGASPRVIWIGIDGDLASLKSLQSDIRKSLSGIGFPVESRDFVPHLTLGRVKHGKRNPKINWQTIPKFEHAGESTVSEILLMESCLTDKGPKYTPLHLFSLTPIS